MDIGKTPQQPNNERPGDRGEAAFRRRSSRPPPGRTRLPPQRSAPGPFGPGAADMFRKRRSSPCCVAVGQKPAGDVRPSDRRGHEKSPPPRRYAKGGPPLARFDCPSRAIVNSSRTRPRPHVNSFLRSMDDGHRFIEPTVRNEACLPPSRRSPCGGRPGPRPRVRGRSARPVRGHDLSAALSTAPADRPPRSSNWPEDPVRRGVPASTEASTRQMACSGPRRPPGPAIARCARPSRPDGR